MKVTSLLPALFFCMVGYQAAAGDPVRDSLEQALAIAETTEEKFGLLMSVAQQVSKIDPEASLAYSLEAASLARELDDPLLLANALNGVAISYYYLGNQGKSLQYLVLSIDQMKVVLQDDSSNLELLYRLAVFSGNAGNVYKGMGQPDKALEMFLQAEGFLEKLVSADPEDLRYLSSYITCLNNKASLSQELGQNENAERNLNKALELSRRVEFVHGIAMCLNNLGLLKIDEGHYPEALTIYLEALQINNRLQDSIAISGTYNNIGLIYEETQNPLKALDYYKLSLRISKRMKYLFGVSNTSINIGKIYLTLNLFDSAGTYLEQGLDAARQGDMLQLQKQSYLHLSALYQQTGHFQKALHAFQEYSTVKDSIYNLERSRQIAEMETRYETEKKEQENILLRTQLTLHKTTQRLLVVALGALFLIATLLVFLWRYKSRILRQKTALFEQQQRVQSLEIGKKEVENKLLEDQMFAVREINRLQRLKLEEQNRKLAATALHVTAKNQLLLTILEEIEKVKESGSRDPDTCFRNIRRTVRANLNLDKDWKQFKRHFEEVHPDFFIRLNNQYPTLTAGEQKICAYYRINLGTHEIAQILNVTVAGVQKSRHRLRKKLGLDSETDMADFMLRF